MKAKDRIKQIVNNRDTDMSEDSDTWEKLVKLAYWMGRESATKETSDKYVKLIAMQNERAKKTRFIHLARQIIGDQEYIYCPDYDGFYTGVFGNDNTNL